MPSRYARHISRPHTLGLLAAATATVSALALFTGPPAQAEPPATIAVSTAHTYLSELTVEAPGSLTGYSRDKFPHWIDQGDNCNTREVVLKRDGTNVTTNSNCYPTSGSWYSVYDGATWSSPSDVDIDHLVPLAEAWRSGANSWTTDERQAFANDLTYPQLIAVTDNVNQSKGDRDPAEWMPPRTAYACTYVRMWIQVKHHYRLSIDSAEKSALQYQLNNSC